MARSNKDKLNTLMMEIANLVDLLVKVDEGSEPVDTLTGQKQKILDLLPVTPAPDYQMGSAGNPLYELLLCRPLTNTEIPLDVLTKLHESRFDVNTMYLTESFNAKLTCLNIAIRNDHFDAVRWLVQHGGADCEATSVVFALKTYSQTPLDILAYKANAPLDLFPLLSTPNSLRGAVHARCVSIYNYDPEYESPLEAAICCGRHENALCLIKLGSPMRTEGGLLMIHKYLDARNMQYHDELFTRLIPSETIDILTVAGKVLKMGTDEGNDSEENREMREKMLYCLFQYIIPKDQMDLCFEKKIYRGRFRGLFKMNNVPFFVSYSFEPVYWLSLLLVNMGWKFQSTPQAIVPSLPVRTSKKGVRLAHDIDDIWINYKNTCRVISLQNICIQQTRRSMRDFSDDSFMSLPVPNKLRKLLMYQHVAEIACEALEMYK